MCKTQMIKLIIITTYKKGLTDYNVETVEPFNGQVR